VSLLQWLKIGVFQRWMVRMKKRWIGLVLLFIATIGVLIGWNWEQIGWRSRAVETSYEQDLASHQERVSIVAPDVQPERLFADLEALNTARYQEADRSRARSYITAALQQAGWVPQEQAYETGINIYAERPGSNPEAGKILLAAHYDTVERSPGVDDNATGVATVLEAARLLRQLETPRTLQLAFFDQEEVGLYGSTAFANGKVDRATLKGAIILDMVGYACYTEGCQSYPSVLPVKPPTTKGDFLAVIGDRGHLPIIDSFTNLPQTNLPQVLTLSIPLLGPLTPDLLRSDHAPFWDKGIGAVLVTDTANFRNPNYHQPTDTIEAIDQDFFAGSAQIIISATTRLLSQSDSLATRSAQTRPSSRSSLRSSL
jgi:hypothetical protein